MTKVCAMTYYRNDLSFELLETPKSSMYITINSILTELMRKRMCHAKIDYIKKLCEVENIELHSTKSSHCEVVATRKVTR